MRIGIDIGGTFTDLLLVDDDTGGMTVVKTLTTTDDPSNAVDAAIREGLSRAAADAAQVQAVIHGTTLVTNAIIERKGERTALITTKGFRDVLEVRREHRYDMYDLFLEPPKEIVPRHLRLEVDERMLADGSVLRSLDVHAVEQLAGELSARRIRSVAVSLLHSYRNPAHEHAIRDVLARVAPEVQTSLSCEVVNEIKEYERTSTTVCNAYVKKLVDRYLAEIERKLRAIGIDGQFHVMLSSGGVATVDTSRRFPVRLLESGPAAGALAAAHVGRLAGHSELLSFDMGGTTAKLCIIEDGRPLRTSQLEVDRVYRFKKGSGLPIRIPVIEMIEIGAGGGSIARIDALGLLQVGPDSAGAEPGPACYARGGHLPTVTDADLVLGYLDPAFFLGGLMPLDVDASKRAIASTIANPLGLDVTRAAWGIHRMVNENMANAARIHTIDRGKNARLLPMFAFGGAGPVHAYAVAAILHTPLLILPLGAGVGSTIGFLAAPLSFDFVRTSIAPIDEVDWPQIDRLVTDMVDEGVGLLAGSGVPQEAIAIDYSVDLRYAGQGHEVTVQVPRDLLCESGSDRLIEAFSAAYRRLYGRVAEDVPLETVNWRVVVTGPPPRLEIGRGQRAGRSAADARKGTRPVFFPEFGGYYPTPVYDRYRLEPGATLAGPAIIEEKESTAIVGPAASATIDAFANLIVRLPHEQDPRA